MMILSEVTTIKYFALHPLILLRFFYNSLKLRILTLIGLDLNLNSSHDSNIPIDIVIPVREKDCIMAGLVIDSIRENVKHPIAQIIIVSPDSKNIIAMSKQKKCKWIHEDAVLPIKAKDVHFTVSGLDRGGWLFQQLLKWGVAKYTRSKYYLVTDADTIYIRPHVFLYKNKTIFACSNAVPHIPYFYAYKKLFHKMIPPVYNLTSHHMLINKQLLKELQNRLEMNFNMPWYQAIQQAVDQTKVSSISDYESYGQYVVDHHRDTVHFEDWRNRSFPRQMLSSIHTLKRKYSNGTKTISFHSYNN